MVFDELSVYMEENNYNASYVKNEPTILYLLMKLSSISKETMIKSSCDESGKIIHGHGFVFLPAKTSYGIRYYKFIVPNEYMSRINCIYGVPFFEEILDPDDLYVPITYIEECKKND